jgi:hypothetical protein
LLITEHLNMSKLDISREERLKQLLKILDTFCSDSSTAAKMQKLADEAKRVVNKMQNFLEHSLVEEVADLVRAEKWDEASEKMKQNFPNGLNIGKVEEILELMFLDVTFVHMLKALNWVVKLDVQFQPRAYQALYEQLKCKNLPDQPQILFLRQIVGALPEGQVSDILRAQLDHDFWTIVGQIAEGIKKNDFSLQEKINEIIEKMYPMCPTHFLSRRLACSTVHTGLQWNCGCRAGQLDTVQFNDVHLKWNCIMHEVVTAVVIKFETITFEETQLLIQYSSKLPFLGNCCVFIDVLMKMLEARRMLTSEQSLQLWSYAKYTTEEQPNFKNISKETQKLCTDVVEKLNMHKLQFFQHYQKYVEDVQNFQKLHKPSGYLCSIVPEFVTWYYKKEDLTRLQNLILATIHIDDLSVIERILTQLQIEMHKSQQMNTFEAFCLFNEVRERIQFRNNEPLEQLKAKIPTCLRRILWHGQNQFQLVNKYYDSPLCIQQDTIICSNSSLDTELLCKATVDPINSKVSFSFQSGTESCKLDAAALKDNTIEETWLGTQWKVKAVDDTHVKIFIDDGKWQFPLLLDFFLAICCNLLVENMKEI